MYNLPPHLTNPSPRKAKFQTQETSSHLPITRIIYYWVLSKDNTEDSGQIFVFSSFCVLPLSTLMLHCCHQICLKPEHPSYQHADKKEALAQKAK